jgi:phage-related protein
MRTRSDVLIQTASNRVRGSEGTTSLASSRPDRGLRRPGTNTPLLVRFSSERRRHSRSPWATLRAAQLGEKSPSAKPLRGFKGAGVLEVIETFDGNAYRVVYTVRFASGVYALHAFQKKSHRGIATDKHDIDVVVKRLREAEEVDRSMRSSKR